MRVLEILHEYADAFFAGLQVTAKLTLVVWGIGLLMGTALAIAANRWRRAVGIPLIVIGFALSGVPVLVLLYWLHYPVQEILGVVIDPFYTAASALSIVNTFLVTVVLWNAIGNFPQEYISAARVCGVPTRTISLRIQLPLLVRQVLPPIVIVQVIMLQSTLFASLISVNEIFRVAQRINSQIYQPIEIYTGLGMLFLLICLPLNAVAWFLRARFGRDISER